MRAASDNPEAITPAGRMINPVNFITQPFRVLNRMARSTLASGIKLLQAATKNMDTSRENIGKIQYARLQNHLEDLAERQEIFENRQLDVLALMDANLIGPDGYPVSADLHSRTDRFALPWSPHGATAPEPPSRGSIFDYGSPFQRVGYPPPLAIEDAPPQQDELMLYIPPSLDMLDEDQVRKRKSPDKEQYYMTRTQFQKAAWVQQQKDKLRSEKKAQELKDKQAKVLADVQKNRRERLKLEQHLGKHTDKMFESRQKELTKKYGARAKAATRNPEQRRIDERAMRESQSGWLIPQMTPEQLQEIRQLAQGIDQNFKQMGPPTNWTLPPPRTGRGKPQTKEVSNIPQPILEYFDVKNDPHFIRAPKHQPQK